MFWRSWFCHGLLTRTIGAPLIGTAEAPAPPAAVANFDSSKRIARTMGTPVRLLSPGAGDAFTWADARPSKVIMTRVVAVFMVAALLERDERGNVAAGPAGLRHRGTVE